LALEMSMAKTPERALELMQAVWKPAVARVAEEVADMQAVADKEGAGSRSSPGTTASTPRRYARPASTSTTTR
jgi:Zn-dependent oligopeptidase